MSTLLSTTSPLSFSNHLQVYETLAIDPSLRDSLEASAGLIAALGRRTTEQTFELGDLIDQTARLLTDGKLLDQWVKARCGLKPRSARNCMAVFRNLSSYRNELVDMSVGSTALFFLSSATPEQIEEALNFGEDNGGLQVADVKTILSGGQKDSAKPERGDLLSAGGVIGLKALIALKIRDGLKAFIGHLDLICEIIRKDLAKKRVIKEVLAKQLHDLARVARLELESLAQFVQPELDLSHSARPTTFPTASPWARVNITLQNLGVVDSWPKSGEMRGWLEAEVLPILEWTMSRERKPQWPLAGLVADPTPMLAEDELVDGADLDVAPADIASVEPEQVDVGMSEIALVSTGPEDPLDDAQTEASAPVGSVRIFRAAPKHREQVSDMPPLASDEFDDAEEEGELAPAVMA